MPRFGLITEGITDQIVIENLLYGFFNNYDLEITELQPLRDATDEDLTTTDANWHKVFEYCKSSVFRAALNQDDFYAIIQIDSDVFLGDSISKQYSIVTRDEAGYELPIETLLENIVSKLIETIGQEHYDIFQEKIIFAIAVHSTECWLLPLYFSNNKKEKVVNCLKTLNEALNKKHKFTIDAKEPDYYRKASKAWRKHKTLIQKYQHNFSLKIFIDNLSDKNIELKAEDDDW